MDYFYDAQIKRYLIQLVRVFSHFEVAENTSSGVNYNRVPCKYAASSRMVAQILRENSENIVSSAPQITVGLQDINIARERSQDPFFKDTKQVAEREWDNQNGVYTSEQGNLYTLERYMPVPYNLTIQVDIWTTNTDSKLQILEQLMVLFNPNIQLQSNDNPLDWSNVFELELTNIAWSSRSIPAGVEDTLDIATLTFDVPVWINPPAKVSRQKIIQKIIADIHTVRSIDELNYSPAYYDFFEGFNDDATVTVTPNDYYVEVGAGTITLLNNSSQAQPWLDLLEMQGELTSVSRVELNLNNDYKDRTELIIGSVSEGSNENELVFNIDQDTLPGNTLDSVVRIIDPQVTQPPSPPSVGDRFLILEPITPEFNNGWNIDAGAHSILEFDGSNWIVAFDPATNTNNEWLENDFTGEQLRWNGTEWISSYQGIYNPGYWRLLL